MSLINCTPIKITYTCTHCYAEKGKEGKEGWQEVRRGAAAGRGTVCFLNLGNVLAALTIISCEPLAGRLWQKRLVAAAAAAQGRRRDYRERGGVAGSCCCLSKRVQTYLKIIKAHALEQREHTHRHTHTHMHFIYTCVCVYIFSFRLNANARGV